MSCAQCQLDYLMNKTMLHDQIIRRLVNIITMSPNCDESTLAAGKSISDIREFDSKWSAARKCTHSSGGNSSGNTEGVIGGKTKTAAANAGSTNATPTAPTANEDFIPPTNSAGSVPLVEPARNVGLNSVPSHAFSDRRTPVGRPVGSKNSDNTGKQGAAAGAKGRK